MRHPPDSFRGRAVQLLLIMSVVLLIAVTAFSMFERQLELLELVLALVRDIVIVILGWAIGRYSPPQHGPPRHAG